MKRFLTVLLTLAMLLSLPVMGVAAADTDAAGDTAGETTDTGAAGTSLGLYGYQNAIVTTGAETVSVRVIAEVADVDAYSSLYFRVKTAKAEKDYPVTSVYGKLTASVTDGDGTAFETELLPETAGNYLAAVILTDIPVSADAEMTITPCGTLKDGTAVTGEAGTLRKPAGKTTFTATYQVRFQTEAGTEISTVSVNRGENAAFPTPASKTYYTATKTEYAKAFNVTANQTITLGTVASSGYSTSNQWINSDENAAAATTKYNADFVSGNWNIASKPMQTKGAYFTISGNYANLELKFYVNKGDIAVYNFYVDDVLVKVLTLDATDAAITTGTGWMVLDSSNMTAGMHTIKIEAADPKSGQVMVVRPTKGPDIKDNYDVTFKNADGSVFTTETVANGTPVTAPATTPTKTAFLFKEWQLNGTTYDFSTPVTQDITLTPTWTFDAEHYSVVKFTVDGKAYGDEQYVEKNGTAVRPATDPTKENYAFKFWTVDGEGAFDFTTPITADTEIKAYFEATAASHTVTYVDPDGKEIDRVTVVDGENAVLPTAPDGYYWKVNLSKLVGITANKTVTLDKVLKSNYKDIDQDETSSFQIVCNMNADTTKYTVGSASSNPPTINKSATILYEVRQSIEFKANFADILVLRGRCHNISSLTFTVEVDGYLIGEVHLEKTTSSVGNVIGTAIPAGEHTVRIVVTEMGETAPNTSCGLFIAGFIFREPNETAE